MIQRLSTYRLITSVGIAIGLAFSHASTAVAQNTEAPLSPAQFDPSDVYLQGYLACREAEKFTQQGEHIRAAEKYRNADELFSTLKKYYPDWKPRMVSRRHLLTTQQLSDSTAKAKSQLDEKRSVVAELEGGEKTGATQLTNRDNLLGTIDKPNILEVDPLLKRRLDEAKAEADRLRNMVERQKQESAEESRKLRQLALDDRKKAEAEIDRLQTLFRQAKAEANKKVQQLQQLSAMAQANAAAEVEKIKKLTGQEKADAEAELARLRALAAKANSDANLEIKKQQRLLAKSNSSAESRIQELRKQAARSQAEAEAEMNRLKKLTQGVKADADASKRALTLNESRTTTQINSLTLAKNALEQKLRAAEANVQTLRSRLARAPLHSEMNDLNAKIKGLEEERQAMAMSLQQSRAGYSKATGKITQLETELNQAKQQAANLARDIDAERKIANVVVAGQRKQLQQLTKELENKSRQLATANNTILSLKHELKQSHEAFGQLQLERDSLLAERDQMAALLKLNEGGRIQDLIEQNMSLAKKLRESSEKLDRLYKDSNSDKDQITEALRDLAIAKSQINSLRSENKKHEERLLVLQKKLEEEQQRLASADVGSDPAEVAVLRDIIQRQLRLQKRKQQARQLLVRAVKDLSSQDNQLAEAVKMLESPNMILSPEEQKLIANRQVDGEFVSPYARDREIVNQDINRLERDIEVFDRAAKKSFLAGRLLPTRELYEMILEQHPGHTPTLCKIGVVHLKLDDPESATDSFRRAIELDAKNAYAHRMFGYSLMQTGNVDDAEAAVRKSIDLDPNDGKAHILLGSLCYQEGRENEAESHFKGAINADPLPSEPYYNLAVIYSESGQLQLAKDYYQKALKRGAIPNPELENAITVR